MSGTVDTHRQPAGDGETGLREVAGKCPAVSSAGGEARLLPTIAS
jgi:hypothetical protein